MHRTSQGRRQTRPAALTLLASALMAWLITPTAAEAGRKAPLEIVHDFLPAEGDVPGTLTRADNGLFYGTAVYGGPLHGGTVFSMDRDGGLQVLHAFDPNQEGSQPSGRLLAARDGALYGSLLYGGDGQCGSLFRITPATGRYEPIRSFHSGRHHVEGCYPSGAMVEGPGGWIYGVTEGGGTDGVGTVYRWQPRTGRFKTLHHFTDWATDGEFPSALALHPSGQLFGLTRTGGEFRVGTVYSLKTDGSDYRVLHHFTYTGGPLGNAPQGQLLLAGDGNFYGVTTTGGQCCGSIFRVTPEGEVSAVYTLPFSGGIGSPVSGDLSLGPGGLIYGTTGSGGPQGGGTVFSLSTAGEVRVVRAFATNETPRSPRARLTRAGSYLYGSASRGDHPGTVIFRILKK